MGRRLGSGAGPAGTAGSVALSLARSSRIHRMVRQLSGHALGVGRPSLQALGRRKNRARITMELPGSRSWPDYFPVRNSSLSPRHVILFPMKPASQIPHATQSRSGMSQEKRKTCRSRSTFQAIRNAVATRIIAATPSSAHAHPAPPAKSSARTAQGIPKVTPNPMYPPRRESRMLRAQRSWC